MFIARVAGQVVSSHKDAALIGSKLLLVEPLKVDAAKDGLGGGSYAPTGRAIVAVDRLGAGQGQLVLVTQGSTSQLAEGCKGLPIDAAVIGLVGEVSIGGKAVK